MGDTNIFKDQHREKLAIFLLRPFRLVRDPVHGDIWLTRLEATLVDQPLFQRLRGIRQLAVSHLVYPGAVHTRFDHSLGTLFIADKIAREAQKNCGSRGYLSSINNFYLLQERDRLLIRLTALLHDAAHVPFGHLIEDEAGFGQEKQWADTGRRKYLSKHLISSAISDFIVILQNQFLSSDAAGIVHTPVNPDLGQCDSSCRNDFNKLISEVLSEDGQTSNEAPKRVIEQIRKFLINEVKPELLSVLEAEEKGSNSIRELNRPLVAEAVGDTICADLLDYLARDAHFTGIEERYDRRIFTYFVAFYQGGKPHMGLLIKKGSKGVRIDAARYIVKLLDMRYALAQMIYTHPAKRAFSALASSMFGSWVMYKLLQQEKAGGEGGAGLHKITGHIQRMADDLILEMMKDDKLNTDDALLTTLINLYKTGGQPMLLDRSGKGEVPLSEQRWKKRAADLARAIKYREKWRRKHLPGFEVKSSADGYEIVYKNSEAKGRTLTELEHLTGSGRMRIEEELERLLLKLFSMRKKEPTSAALVSLHVPKLFKPKEADVNVVLVHDDGDKKEAYAGSFKHLGKEHLSNIKQVGGRGSLSQSDYLEKQTKSIEPMLGVLSSIANSTVKLTVAEYYLHPEADEFLDEIDAEKEFTEIVGIMVALRRSLNPKSAGGNDEEYKNGSIAPGAYYERYQAVLEELVKKAMGNADVGETSEREILAAHSGEDPIPTDLKPADDITTSR